jgi:hypothetical protein
MDESGRAGARREDLPREEDRISPAWREFIRFCRELRHGEIERLCIQDGIPVLAEITKRKVKFNGRC